MPKRSCLKCGTLSDQSYCPNHRHLAGGTGQRGTTRRWARIRRRILERDQHRCTYIDGEYRCEEMVELDVHHVIPVSHGGTDEDENLRTLCANHHGEADRMVA